MQDEQAYLRPELEKVVQLGQLTSREAWLLEDELLLRPEGSWPRHLVPLARKLTLASLRPEAMRRA